MMLYMEAGRLFRRSVCQSACPSVCHDRAGRQVAGTRQRYTRARRTASCSRRPLHRHPEGLSLTHRRTRVWLPR